MQALKRLIRRAANRFGYEIIRAPIILTELPPGYGAIQTMSNYCPWLFDMEFMEAFRKIEEFTLVDLYRCYELWKAVEQSAKLEKGSILEVGVWRGGTAALLASQARRCGISEPVILCDTFAGVVKAGANDSYYMGGEHADASRDGVASLLEKTFGLNNFQILEGVFPEETGSYVEDLSFRFCHIDVDVYQSAKDIVTWIWDRLVPGGIIIFDDYGCPTCGGVAKFVNAEMGSRDKLVFYNLNGHAIFVKR